MLLGGNSTRIGIGVEVRVQPMLDRDCEPSQDVPSWTFENVGSTRRCAQLVEQVADSGLVPRRNHCGSMRSTFSCTNCPLKESGAGGIPATTMGCPISSRFLMIALSELVTSNTTSSRAWTRIVWV